MAPRYILPSPLLYNNIIRASSGRLTSRSIVICTPVFGPTRRGATCNMSTDASRPPITTPPAGKYEFLVVIPDRPGMQQKRLEVRPKHFEGIQALVDSGVFKVGGAALNDTPEGTDATKWDFYGSTIVMVAKSKEECQEILRKDIYSTSGVWDVDNAQIWPVKLAFRYP